LRCLVGLLKPTNGSVLVNGLRPLADHRQLMSHVGYLPGELRLYDELTANQHLDLLGDLQGVATPRRGELCERLGLSTNDLRRPIRDYSRGMKQKVGLVQALQHDPSVALLDEPTEGLDPLVQETFFELLQENTQRGNTVLLSSHVMSEVERACHRVAIVRSGELVTVDSVDTLRRARARHLRFRFADDFDRSTLAVPPTWNVGWQHDTMTVDLPPNEVVDALRLLLQAPVVDVTVEDAGLDETLLSYYRHTEGSTS
jgi:ABC-2 type transport system ATP-binding protein